MFFRVGGESLARLLFDGFLEERYEFFQVVDVELVVEFYAFFLLHLFDDGFEGVDVVFARGLHAEHDVAIHLYEAAVGVVGKARVVGFPGQAFNDLVVQTEVEDGVHHAGHRGACARAHGEEQRVVDVAKAVAHQFFNVEQALFNVVAQQLYHFLFSDFVIFVANVGRDGEARGYGNADQVHLGQVGSFAAQKISHVGPPFGLTVSERVNSFLVLHR